MHEFTLFVDGLPLWNGKHGFPKAVKTTIIFPDAPEFLVNEVAIIEEI